MNDLYIPENFNKLFTPVDSFTASSGSHYLAYLFDEGNKSNQEIVNSVINKLIAASPVFANIVEGLKTTEVVNLVFSEKAVAKMKSGEWKIGNSRDTEGLLRAWVTDEKGHIVEHAEIDISQQMQGLNMVQIANAMQSLAMMKKLSEISQQLTILNGRIDEIKTGQQNDRVGLFYAAENLYRESEFVLNSTLKERLITCAIANLTECIEKTKQTTLSDSIAIVRNYDAKSNSYRDLKQNARLTPSIKNDLQLIHAASILKAGIYYKEHELQSVICALHEYKMFLEAFLPDDKSYRALYYADNQSKTINEFWGVRKSLPTILIDTCMVLADPNLISLTYCRPEVK